MNNKLISPTLFAITVLLVLLYPISGLATTITIINNDGPNEGLNDPTPMTPIDGNDGTTLGEQRMIVLQFAADFLETIINSNIEIKIEASFDPLTPGFIGMANMVSWELENYPNTTLPFHSTYYPQALANHFYGYDRQPQKNDMAIQLNSNYANNLCDQLGLLADPYLGLNNKTTLNCQQHVLGTVLHEIIHGLGFYETLNKATGAWSLTNPDIYSTQLEDHSNMLLWPNMNNTQRIASLSQNNLHWIGLNAAVQSLFLQSHGAITTGHWPAGHISMHTSNEDNLSSAGSHFAKYLYPNEIMEHTQDLDDPKNTIGLAKQVLQDIGWPVFFNGDKPLLSKINDAEIFANTSYHTDFSIFDNDNALHYEKFYNWSSTGRGPHLIMGVSANSSDQSIVADSDILISGVTNGLSDSPDTLRQLIITPQANATGMTTITIEVLDVDGNSDLMTFMLIVNASNTPPVVSITNPSNGHIFLTTTQPFSATANDIEDGNLSNIDWGVRAAGGNWQYDYGVSGTWTKNLADGSYDISACVSDSNNATACDQISVSVSATADADNDGISNADEVAQGTDPFNNDSDNDGLLDGEDPDPLTPTNDALTVPAMSGLGFIALCLSMLGLGVARRRTNETD